MENAANKTETLNDRNKRERRFYCRMAYLVAALIFMGFGPSFYLKPFNLIHFPRPEPQLNPVLMTHGLLFSLWVALFIAQTQLVAIGRRDLHRALGVISFALAVIMIPVMYFAVLDQLSRNSGTPFTDALGFSAVPLFPIPFYAALLWMGWTARRTDLQSHKRLMLGLMIMLTQPAVSRLPILPPTLAGFMALSSAGLLMFIPLILWDRRSIGKIHPATMRTTSIYVVILAGQAFFLANPAIWKSFASQLPGVA